MWWRRDDEAGNVEEEINRRLMSRHQMERGKIERDALLQVSTRVRGATYAF